MSEQKTINRALLDETLERFGGDPMRWPETIRGALQALIADDPVARASVKEFAALDQVLTRAGETAGPDNPARHDALAERIMSSIATATRATDGGNVVAFEPQRQRTPSTNRLPGGWPNVAAAGALAASLLLGITIGATGIANNTLTPVSEALGLGSIATETAALSDPIFDVVDGNSYDDDVL